VTSPKFAFEGVWALPDDDPSWDDERYNGCDWDYDFGAEDEGAVMDRIEEIMFCLCAEMPLRDEYYVAEPRNSISATASGTIYQSLFDMSASGRAYIKALQASWA
jgi:hypothetical protein